MDVETGFIGGGARLTRGPSQLDIIRVDIAVRQKIVGPLLRNRDRELVGGHEAELAPGCVAVGARIGIATVERDAHRGGKHITQIDRPSGAVHREVTRSEVWREGAEGMRTGTT